MKKSLPIAIVGAGLAGLSAACVLAARKHRVIVYEKNAWAGGKAAVHQQQGFRFDMGPTILTIPSVLRRIFAEADRRLEDELDLVRLDPQWRCFFEDGSRLDLCENVKKMARTVGRFANDDEDADGYESFLKASHGLHELSNEVFFWRSVGGVRDAMRDNTWSLKRSLNALLELRMGRSVTSVIRQHVADPRVVQMMEHFTQYVGSAPDNSPAVLCGIASMQHEEGIWYPMGGTAAVPAALKKLAQSLGVEFRFETGVERINVESDRVRSIKTHTGETVEVAAVVSNNDAPRTYNELIGGAPARKFIRSRSMEPACSGVVLYLGLKQRYEHLAHHSFVFSRDPHEEFAAIYHRGVPAPDPTCYVCAPSSTEPGVAPPGGEALYILVHTPYLHDGQDWSKLFPAYRQTILDKLKRTAGLKDIESRIVCEHHLTPVDIETRYRAWKGAIYGLASHGKFTGAFKPANRRTDIGGLYLAGGAAHPGPGMPMVLMSGWIAADCADRDLSNSRSRLPSGI